MSDLRRGTGSGFNHHPLLPSWETWHVYVCSKSLTSIVLALRLRYWHTQPAYICTVIMHIHREVVHPHDNAEGNSRIRQIINWLSNCNRPWWYKGKGDMMNAHNCHALLVLWFGLRVTSWPLSYDQAARMVHCTRGNHMASCIAACRTTSHWKVPSKEKTSINGRIFFQVGVQGIPTVNICNLFFSFDSWFCDSCRW